MSAANDLLPAHLSRVPDGLELTCSDLRAGMFHACWIGHLADGRGIAAYGIGPTREAAIVAACITLEMALAELPPEPITDVGQLGTRAPRGSA